jgi:hypothetical protein
MFDKITAKGMPQYKPRQPNTVAAQIVEAFAVCN